LQKFIKKQHDQTSYGELGYNKDGVNDTEFPNWSVHAGEQVGQSFTDGDDDAEELLCRLEKFSVVF
jgi:hypothetical protein